MAWLKEVSPMIEIRIHGRGGQGGVTLAKIIATAHHLRGNSVQAFGIYAAERSGAPLQAFVRYDTQPITNRNLIYEPDHVIVLDHSLVSPAIVSGLKAGGWILINTTDAPATLAKQPHFAGYRIATVDATAIARNFKLGTASVPIVNTALSGATARILGLELDSMLKALDEMGFRAGNLDAAKRAYDETRLFADIKPLTSVKRPAIPTTRIPGLIHGNTGAPPTIRTGKWATQQPGEKESLPPCNFICPAGNNVQGFLAALARNEVDRALEILLETTPLPSVCGRVCPGFCMQECNRSKFDDPVNVRALERYAGDHGSCKIQPTAKRRERMAVVGSGPAGLSGAYHLARLGYDVTLFEASPELGGLMRTGIPAYRLPRESLDRDIHRILKLGVKTIVNRRIDQKTLAQLTKDYDAVLVATGLQKSQTLDLGANSKTVMQGIDFLENARTKSLQIEGEEIVVVGGGNTAIDAACSAFRLGAKHVRIVYRRTREEMPAIDEEIDEAIDEGVQIDYLTSPVKITSSGDRNVLTCRRMKLGDADQSGRRRPIEIPDSDFQITCDRVILALGQYADLPALLDTAAEGMKISEGTPLLKSGKTPALAAGDLLTNDGTVTAAIGCGRRMALRIHENLTGETLIENRPTADQVIRADRIKMHLFEHLPQQKGRALLPEERRRSFNEVHQGLPGPEEAKRCLSCGVCNECNRCVTFCPDAVLKRVGDDLVFDYDYCKGCGVCATECPRAVLYMKGV